MEDYKPNSHLSKKEESTSLDKRKIEPVAKGKVAKKSLGRKFSDVFMADDIGKVKSYALTEVLIPSLKKAISDIVSNGINMMLYGETKRSNRTSDTVSYRKYYEDPRNDEKPYRRPGTSYTYDDIVFDTHVEAEKVLDKLEGAIETYDKTSVADFYDACDITGRYTDNYYGWTNLSTAEIVRVRDGWMITLPKAVPLK